MDKIRFTKDERIKFMRRVHRMQINAEMVAMRLRHEVLTSKNPSTGASLRYGMVNWLRHLQEKRWGSPVLLWAQA